MVVDPLDTGAARAKQVRRRRYERQDAVASVDAPMARNASLPESDELACSPAGLSKLGCARPNPTLSFRKFDETFSAAMAHFF